MAESGLRADSTLYPTLQITRRRHSYIRICPIVCNDLLVVGGRKSLLSVSTLQSDQLLLSYFRTNEHNSSLWNRGEVQNLQCFDPFQNLHRKVWSIQKSDVRGSFVGWINRALFVLSDSNEGDQWIVAEKENLAKIVGMICNVSWRSNMYAGDLKIVHTNWKLSGFSEMCPYHLKVTRINWKVSWWSEKCLDDLKCSRVIWKVSKSSENYPAYLKSVHIIWKKLSGLSEKCPYHLKGIRIICNVTGWSESV